ncbi:MAG: site-specific integrase, partial [Acinetobacter sp.]|nr:site-specific integrase [Acinetobacter sp.]
FSVKSLVMKTGVSGHNETKAVTLRPMILSIAKLMWKIESFNKKVIQLGINLPSLFNLLGSSEKKLNFPTSVTVSPYTYICDYFETPFINENGIAKKLYFSNHQLRRFFAMMFFWSNGYDGLDAIRWMLGHSSSEHLYHYITETCNGAVLNGIKAAHLVNEVHNGHLKTIDALRKAISQYYDVEQANIELERISDAINDYINDEDYETRPSYISDKDLSAIEDTIYQLLHQDVIRLEPEFFTIVREGKAIQDYRMILEVRELA